MLSFLNSNNHPNSYEEERINILHQTNLLDSNTNDNDYDRFTSLAKRIFNVPIALVSLVDTNRQWFKSKDGLDAAETPRDISFCTHVVKEDAPDVLVVLDAKLDERFKNNPLVIGPPHVIFYGGAAIMVDHVKIGTLCIIDNKPHDEFSMKDRMTLLDLGFAVGTLVQKQLESRRKHETEKLNLMTSIMHNLRTPMMSLAFVRSLLDSKSDDMLHILRKLPKKQSSEFLEILVELDSSVRQLNIIIETSLSLGNSMVEISNFSRVSSSDYSSNVNEKWVLFKLSSVIERLKKVSKGFMNDNVSEIISWEVDKTYFRDGDDDCYCFPEVIFFIIMTVFAGSFNQGRLHVKISFQNVVFNQPISQCNECIKALIISDPSMKEPLPEARVVESNILTDSNGDKWISGDMIIEISHVDKKDKLERYDAKVSTTADVDSIGNLLQEINGSAVSNTSSDGLTSIVNYNLPCSVRAFEGDKDHSAIKEPVKEVENIILSSENDQRIEKLTDTKEPSQTLPADRILNVLVIEDSIAVQKLMNRWWTNAGCRVQLADNGKIGLEWMKTMRFDIVLLDFLMPVMSGPEALKAFSSWNRQQEITSPSTFNSGTLIIGMSATASSSEQTEAFESGMHLFFPKPVDVSFMKKILDSCKSSNSLEDILKCFEVTEAQFPMKRLSSESKTYKGSDKENDGKSFTKSISRTFLASNKVMPESDK